MLFLEACEHGTFSDQFTGKRSITQVQNRTRQCMIVRWKTRKKQMSEQQNNLREILSHLESIVEKLNHSDQVFHKVNENSKRCLKTYYALIEQDNTTTSDDDNQVRKGSTTVEKQQSTSSKSRANEVQGRIKSIESNDSAKTTAKPKVLQNKKVTTKGTTSAPANNKSKPPEKSEQEKRLEKILVMARTIRHKETAKKMDDKSRVSDNQSSSPPEINSQLNTSMNIDVVDSLNVEIEKKISEKLSEVETTYDLEMRETKIMKCDEIRDNIKRMKSVKKQRERAIVNYLNQSTAFGQNVNRASYSGGDSSSIQNTKHFSKMYRQVLLASLDDYMDHLNEALKNVVSDTHWSRKTDKCSEFYQLYHSFDRHVTSNLLDLDPKKAREYERKLLDSLEERTDSNQMSSSDSDYSHENTCAYLGEWGLNKTISHGQTAGIRQGQHGSILRYEKEKDLVQFHHLQSEIQSKLLGGYVEHILGQYLLPQYENGEYSENDDDNRRVYRLLDSCLLKQGRDFCTFGSWNAGHEPAVE